MQLAAENPSGLRHEWFLASTRPQSEWRAADSLLLRGFDVFVPTIVWRRRRRGKSLDRRQQLFPSYLFVSQPVGAHRYAEIEQAPGIAAIVKFQESPIILPARLIDEIAFNLTVGCYVWDERRDLPRYVNRGASKERLANFSKGGVVRVTDGAFQGLFGRIVAAQARERIEVLLDIFGRQTRTMLDVAQVEP